MIEGRTNLGWLFWCTTAGTFATIAYAGAYFAMMKADRMVYRIGFNWIEHAEPTYYCPTARFPAGSQTAWRTFFAPAHFVHRLTRPTTWAGWGSNAIARPVTRKEAEAVGWNVPEAYP